MLVYKTNFLLLPTFLSSIKDALTSL